MASIHDVARQAGVATSTVSRVVNNSGYVARDVRGRVEAAIATVGWVPSGTARSLRSQRTQTLALVVTDVTNPFFTAVARGVEDGAAEAGFLTILCNTNESDEKEARSIRMLIQKRVDGVLLVPTSGAAASLAALQRSGVPTVLLDRRVAGAPMDCVRCDSEAAAYELGRMLTGLGHIALAMLAGPVGVSTSDDRVAGWTRALREARLEAGRVHHGEFTQSSGYELARQALSEGPRPSALFAANNFQTIGALRAIADAGRSVPDDVALVGFDDLPAAMLSSPFLTVAEQPAAEMGRTAVRLLLDRLAGTASAEPREVVLPIPIVVRGSSGGTRPRGR